ncbi:MAG: class I SAM-dependent methyltransferase [Bacteroidales bacterium]|nr:class I SAM-dependent methyltransferase [Bacteroidales bacterium]
MKYDPIKKSLGKVFNQSIFLRKLLYYLLDLLLLRSWYIKKILKKWAKQQNGHRNILDAGSGFGQYTYFLQSLNKNWSITGVDVKQEQIDDCNNFFKKAGYSQVKFEYGDLTNYTPAQKFDLILCVDVMEHIEEDVSVFNNYGKILNEGGLLLISTPSDLGGSDVHDEHDSSFIDEHVRDGYNVEDIKTKIFNAGFKKVEPVYSYGRFGSISWKISMKFPIMMLNFSKLFFIILPLYYIIVFPIAFILNTLDLNSVNKSGTGLIVKAFN